VLGLKKSNLLIVDDSSTILNILENTANQLGSLTPYLAKSFEEATQLIHTQDFDVAILDIDLPDAHNGEVVDLAIGHGIASIVLTGTFNETVRASVLSKPIADYIVKSNLEEIRNAVFMAENFAMFKDKKVLIVDDSKVSRSILRSHFLSLNFKIFTAEDGSEALAILSKNPGIDLITVDYEMPGMNGIEFVQHVKSIMKVHTPVIIGVCASSSESTVVKFLKSGANDVFAKPIIKEMLNLKVANIMKLLRQQRDLLTSQKIADEYSRALSAGGLITKADIDGTITFVNEEFCSLTGYSEDELIGKPHSIFRHPQTSKGTFKEMWETLLAKKTWKGVLRNIKKDGSSFYVKAAMIPILDLDNNIVEFVAIRDDVTQLVENKEELKNIFYNDSLTGLGNRHRLLADLRSALSPGVVIIDIKDFKTLNHAFSSQLGDYVIKECSNRLFECFDRDRYSLYHIGADQFAVTTNVENESDKKEFEWIVEICLTKLQNSTFSFDEQDFALSARAGVSYMCQDISKADMALKHAKATGRDFVIFTDELRLSETYKTTFAMIKKIKQAIVNESFVPYFQPIVCNKTGKVEEFECLVRMISGNEIIMPNNFLDIAKKSGLYLPITRIMLQKCTNLFSKNRYNFAINITVEDILDKETCKLMINTLDFTKTASRTIFELVESEGIESAEQVSDFLESIRKLGVRLAIDDFGTGYSNFDYLIRLRADHIKIDGSLIKKINTDEKAYALVGAIVDFAKNNNYKTVAEFVSSKEIFEKVKELDIDFSQGYYISEPKSSIELASSYF
jgi:PAS domain S-box-containing protein/diguanylate cyclase (GGDEF)-like protein